MFNTFLTKELLQTQQKQPHYESQMTFLYQEK